VRVREAGRGVAARREGEGWGGMARALPRKSAKAGLGTCNYRFRWQQALIFLSGNPHPAPPALRAPPPPPGGGGGSARDTRWAAVPGSSPGSPHGVDRGGYRPWGRGPGRGFPSPSAGTRTFSSDIPRPRGAGAVMAIASGQPCPGCERRGGELTRLRTMAARDPAARFTTLRVNPLRRQLAQRSCSRRKPPLRGNARDHATARHLPRAWF